MAEYAKNHLAPVVYLKAWADDSGRVAVRRRRGPSGNHRPESVGYRKNWWGHPEIARQVEGMYAQSEARIKHILAAPEADWPLHGQQFVAVTVFMAALATRTPAWRTHMEQLVRSNLAHGSVNDPRLADPRALAAVTEHLTSDTERANRAVTQVTRVATMLAHMRPTLLRADRPGVLTCDQPMIRVPLAHDPQQPVDPAPVRGILSTLEVRFPLGPHHVLLLDWLDEPAANEIVVMDEMLLAELNRAVWIQANTEAFHVPGRVAATVAAPWVQPENCVILSQVLRPDYDLGRVARSDRFRQASRLVNEMVENEVHDKVTTLTVRPRAA